MQFINTQNNETEYLHGESNYATSISAELLQNNAFKPQILCLYNFCNKDICDFYRGNQKL